MHHETDEPPPLPDGTTWTRDPHGTFPWHANLPNGGRVRVRRADDGRTWDAVTSGRNLHYADGYRTRDLAARHAAYSAGFIRAA